ncbi:hypothetical protein ACFQH8_18450 [Halomicroarcula sp. GCM10025710]
MTDRTFPTYPRSACVAASSSVVRSSRSATRSSSDSIRVSTSASVVASGLGRAVGHGSFDGPDALGQCFDVGHSRGCSRSPT